VIRLPGDGVIVSTQWLAENLGAPDLCVVDIRGKVLPPGNTPRYRPEREAYEAAHVPGAVFVDWTRDIVDAGDPVPVQLATPEAFAAKMADLGIGDGTTVVAYDDYKHAFAGRLAWALRAYGHESVAVLDGGWSRWIAEGRPVSKDLPVRPHALFTARSRPELRRTADAVQASLATGALIIDARAPEQYSGAVTPAARGGHIPGALNVPYPRMLDPETGRFLPAADLARVFAEAGIDVTGLPPGREVVVYCNGGVTCTVPLSALRMLGRAEVAVYDGSWNEWGNDPSRPVHTGTNP
jgi:thiosulfate/3-mercaptopyruvate sulfurtransferase